MESKLDRVLSRAAGALLVGCAIVLTAIVARREFFPRSAAGARSEPVRVDDWPSVAADGHRSGPANAAVVIVEFSDFQCPACARYERETKRALRSAFPTQVAFVYRHWPLSSHPLAYPAARAAECAAAQGKFDAFHDALFAKQDSIGIRSFTDFAREVGVSNVTLFEQCNSLPGPVPAIEKDIAEVRRIGGRGTPTVIINGWWMHSLDRRVIDSAVRAEVAQPSK